MAHAADSRRMLRQLMLDGCGRRSAWQLFQQMVRAFEAAGEALSKETFDSWICGLRFPANRKRQLLVAEVIGGACGEAIKRLPGPAFRGWRRRVMKETDAMANGLSSKNMKVRQFTMVPIKGEDGRQALHAKIVCIECGKAAVHQRRGNTQAEEYFRNKGWQVGKSSTHDYCPECVAKRKVVVKMEDHVKNNQPKPDPVMSKEDGRILSRMIEDHWDENVLRYLPGWSDKALADSVGKPVEWVKAIRERDFGGTGEDPQLVDFIAAQVTIKGEMAELQKTVQLLENTASEVTVAHTKLMDQLGKYRDKHNALAAKVQRVSEAAEKLPPFKAAG